MNELVPCPRKGDDVRIAWAQTVADGVNAARIAAGPGIELDSLSTGGTLVRAAPERPVRAVPPPPLAFAAIWLDDPYTSTSGTNREHAGKLCFYLPAGSLTVDGDAVDPAENATAVSSGRMPRGSWYYFPSLTLAASGTTRVYCEITESSGGYSADLVAQAQVSPGALYSFPVCDITISAATSDAPAQHIVRQLAAGAQHVSLADTVSVARDKWYNRLTVTETQITVSNVCAFAGDRLVSSGQTFTLARPASGDAMVYLHVTLTADTGGSISGQVTAEVDPQNVVYEGADFYIPVWRVEADGTIYDATIPGVAKRT